MIRPRDTSPGRPCRSAGRTRVAAAGHTIRDQSGRPGCLRVRAGVRADDPLRATLDRLDLSAAEAGHLLGVHRATIYRWLDGSMSVPIVVELLLRLTQLPPLHSDFTTASACGRDASL
jgi:hypothetical protein